MSVYTYILEGKYDSGLKWPFVGDVNIKLLNQVKDKNHHTCNASPVTDTKTHGLIFQQPYFIAHSALGLDRTKNTQYLKNDTLYIRISVEVPDQEPWLQCGINNCV